jgi:hypothetical protein
MRHTSLLATLACLALAACSGASVTDAPPGDDPAPGGPLGERRVFPADNPWNTDISAEPVDPSSDVLVAACGVRNLHPDFGSVYGIP